MNEGVVGKAEQPEWNKQVFKCIQSTFQAGNKSRLTTGSSIRIYAGERS